MVTTISTQVAIVGAGPCGITIANYLGLYGIQTLLLERSETILDYPRAVGADDEALRSWQGIGLADELLHDMIQNAPARYYNSKGRCFAQVSPKEQPHGWPRRNLFIQPLTEVTLRKGISRFPSVTFMQGVEVTGLSQDQEQVCLKAQDSAGNELQIDCQYVVGADGGKSTIRGLIGVSLIGKTHTNKWLVVDVLNDTLDAPFTAIHCHPERPSISIHLPYGYRRLEFQLQPTDDEEKILEPDSLAALMRPHYSQATTLPEIKRARIYLHHSRIAEKFQVGRVFLAGDAAHLQPPFFGQGMNSGLRDATNIAWKLAHVLKGQTNPRILDSYDSERRDHALTMVNFATWIGSFYKPKSRFTEFLRDLFFRSVQALPSIKDYVLQLKFKPMSRYTNGIVIPLADKKHKNDPIGRMFMQPLVEKDNNAMKLDDAIGPGFAVIGINFDPATMLDDKNKDFIQVLNATSVYMKPSKSLAKKTVDSPSMELEDLQGKFRDWLMQNPQWQFVVLRPDRYVAAVGTQAELNDTLHKLRNKL